MWKLRCPVVKYLSQAAGVQFQEVWHPGLHLQLGKLHCVLSWRVNFVHLSSWGDAGGERKERKALNVSSWKHEKRGGKGGESPGQLWEDNGSSRWTESGRKRQRESSPCPLSPAVTRSNGRGWRGRMRCLCFHAAASNFPGHLRQPQQSRFSQQLWKRTWRKDSALIKVREPPKWKD